MKRFQILLFAILPLLATLSCGELELPQPPATEEPTPGNTDGTTENPADGKDEPPTPSDDPDSPDGDGEETGQTPEDGEGGGEGAADEGHPTPPANDRIFGKARLTSDGHLLIDDRIYFSVIEYRDVLSALSSTPNAAANIAAAYTEGRLTDGWRIPTLDDVAILRDALAGPSPYYPDPDAPGSEVLPNLNQALDEAYLDGIFRERYLCDGAKRCFTFNVSESIQGAAKSTKYRLRLVRDK